MANKKHDPMTEAALEVMKAENQREKITKGEQELKERAIAQVFEMSGKIKAVAFFESQTKLMKLLYLKQVKDAKTYREKFGMTWEQFCEHAGEDRRRVDEDLMDLKPFKTEWLTKFVNGFGVEINKIKYLGEAISANSAKIQDNAIVYDGEIIPLTPERKDDIQALLEKLEDASKSVEEELKAQKKAFERVSTETHKEITKLQKQLDRFEGKAKEKGFTGEEDAFLQKIENLTTMLNGYLLQIDPERMPELIPPPEEDEKEGEEDGSKKKKKAKADTEWVEPTPRMRAAYLSMMGNIKMQVLAYYDTAVVTHGDPVMCPESAWQQPE